MGVRSLPYSSLMSFAKVCDETVEETSHGYRCRGSVEVKGQATPVWFALLVPPGTYAKIEANFGRRFVSTNVRALFEARISQYLENATFLKREIDLGSVDVREVDGLFCDIRRANRLRRQAPE